MLTYIVAIVVIPIVGYVLYWLTVPIRQSFEDSHAVTYTPSFYNPSTKALVPFPSVYDRASVKLSLIVPAYNEEKRMSVMLDETLDYLHSKYPKNNKEYEIIIVDDGSKDKTTEKALEYSEKHGADVIRVMTLKKNQGKGGAVQQGMLHARGEYLLMVDADGASEIQDFDKMEKALRSTESKGHGIALGSRAHLADTAVAKRKWYRNVLMYGFHFLVTVVGGISKIQDTQCGFKLFTRKTAQVLFYNQRLRRWCFDIELLHVGQRLGYIPMVEVPISWQEIPGSKLNMLESSFQMGRDLLVVRICYLTGLWKIEAPQNLSNGEKTSVHHSTQFAKNTSE